jgi:hypothetical protein
MRANICEPNETEQVARFRALLVGLGAEKTNAAWAVGVDMWTFAIGTKELRIFQDAWSLDIEGPDDLVTEIVAQMKA